MGIDTQEPWLGKILLLGPDKSGKTSIAKQLCQGKFPKTYQPTIGVEFYSLRINQDKIVIWDCGGKPHLRQLWEIFYSGAHGILFVIDSSDTFSIAESVILIQKIRRSTQTAILIIANNQQHPNALDVNELQNLFSMENVLVVGSSAAEKTKLQKYLAAFLKKVKKGSKK